MTPEDKVKALLAAHERKSFTHEECIRIPKRMTMAEFPEEVLFSEGASLLGFIPEFGSVVAQVIAAASSIEIHMLRVAICQHGKDALLAARTAYKLLQSDSQRRGYIYSFAEETGQPLLLSTIKWAYAFAKPIFEIRNGFAHGIWGECNLIPNSLILCSPEEQLIAQAAHAQLMGYSLESEKESQILMNIVTGNGASTLSDKDKNSIIEIVSRKQNDVRRLEAFEMQLSNPKGIRPLGAEVWTRTDFRNAVLASRLAEIRLRAQLTQTEQWLCGLRAIDDLAPLPPMCKESHQRK